MEQDLARLKSEVERLRPTDGGTGQTPESCRDVPTAARSPQSVDPWLDGAGMFRDDPLFDDWQRAIAEHRRDADRVADAP